LAIALGIIESVQKVYATWTRCRETYAEPAGVLGIANSGKGSCFFMPHLDESNLILSRAESFKNTVHSIARKSKDCVYSPVNKSLNQHVGHGLSHFFSSTIHEPFMLHAQPTNTRTSKCKDRRWAI